MKREVTEGARGVVVSLLCEVLEMRIADKVAEGGRGGGEGEEGGEVEEREEVVEELPGYLVEGGGHARVAEEPDMSLARAFDGRGEWREAREMRRGEEAGRGREEREGMQSRLSGVL